MNRRWTFVVTYRVGGLRIHSPLVSVRFSRFMMYSLLLPSILKTSLALYSVSSYHSMIQKTSPEKSCERNHRLVVYKKLPFRYISKSKLNLNLESFANILQQSAQDTVDSHPFESCRSSEASYHASVTPPSWQGLSKFHLSILSRTTDRPRFVTGKYPIIVCAIRNPTRKWLNLGRKVRKDGSKLAETDILVNGTVPEKSLASIDRFDWIEDDKRAAQESFETVSLEFLAEINIERPGYLQIVDCSGAGSSSIEYSNTSIEKIEFNHQHFGSDNVKLSRRPTLGTTEHQECIQRERLWVTGFSLASRRGIVMCVDTKSSRIRSINDRSAGLMLWPNEIVSVPFSLVARRDISEKYLQSVVINKKLENSQILMRRKSEIFRDALLVCDGFLIPTKDKGSLYVVQNPGNPALERTVSLTQKHDRWFYHRAVWIDLTDDGRKSILTARCKFAPAFGKRRSGDGIVTSGIRKYGQLVWLECPKPHSFDESGIPLEEDGSPFDPFDARHVPWKSHVLATGPDVMFSVADLDITDDTVEVISSQFFSKKVGLHSIRKGSKPKVVFSRFIDDNCGQAFGCILTDLDRDVCESSTLHDSSDKVGRRQVIDSGSTVKVLNEGDYFSHLLVTSHECIIKDYKIHENSGTTEVLDVSSEDSSTQKMLAEGGSLYAYRVPEGINAWKTEEWTRSIISSGFKVNQQLKNFINPGAPGFVYTFYARKDDTSKRPMIAVAGDCAESAYIFRPDEEIVGNCTDRSTIYKLMVEIECGATVGSIGIGYDSISSTDPNNEYAKLFVPCYEHDKVLVFGLGNGKTF